MSLKVDSVRIQRFKNIKDVCLGLDDVTLLIGANNAGKSAVLQAIQFVTSIAQCVGDDGLQGSEPARYATVSPGELYYSPVDEVMTIAYGMPLTQNEDQGIRLDFTCDDKSFHLSFVKGRNGHLSIRTSADECWESLSSLEQPFSMYVPGLAGIASSEQYLTPVTVRKAAAQGHGNSVLRNVLWQLHRDGEKWNDFARQLDAVFPLHALYLEHDPEKDESVSAYVSVDSTRGRPIGLSGTGLLQTIQILAYANLYRPSLLLLDEPDSHIHPNNQRALLGVVTEGQQNREQRY